MFERMAVGPLRVHRDWYVGLNADPIDHSHPDVADTPDGNSGTELPDPSSLAPYLMVQNRPQSSWSAITSQCYPLFLSCVLTRGSLQLC